jgi:hypothetical protein
MEGLDVPALLSRLSPFGTRKRALAFAAKHFEGCDTHRPHAEAVHAGLEHLIGRALGELDPKTVIAEILSAPGISSSHDQARGTVDSLDAIELQLEVDAAMGTREVVERALRQRVAGDVLKALLGPAAERTTWDLATVSLRSVRGIINERVRHFGTCTCGERSAPSNRALAGDRRVWRTRE